MTDLNSSEFHSVPSWYSDPSAPTWSDEPPAPATASLPAFELAPLPWETAAAPAQPEPEPAQPEPEPAPVLAPAPVLEVLPTLVEEQPPTISFEPPAATYGEPDAAPSPFGEFTVEAGAAPAPVAVVEVEVEAREPVVASSPSPFGEFTVQSQAAAVATAPIYSPAEESVSERNLAAVQSGPSAWDNPKRDLDILLTALVECGGSDLHLTAGIAPCMRIDGSLAPMPDRSRLLPDDTQRIARAMLTDAQWEKFERTQELDTSYTIPGVSRYRVNVFRQRSSVGMVFRSIPHHIRSLSELGMPDSVEDLARLPRGLVLVTGPTGSGKSTTLASLLDVANRTRSGHIVTIEDPIEYLHQHKKCVVNQREIGSDTEDFSIALKHVLRQDPDIILVGELRDLETTSVAVTAAETGHLVLATLHTQSAAQTIDRLIDIYPADQQQQIRAQLSNCLQAVVTQALAPRKDAGRAVVCEIMLATPAIRNLIREGKVHQIPSFLQSSRDLGMISFDQHLAERYSAQMISKGVALDLCHDENEFRRLARI